MLFANLSNPSIYLCVIASAFNFPNNKINNTILLLERVAGIEPAYSAWKADVLPLNYTRSTSMTTPAGFGLRFITLCFQSAFMKSDCLQATISAVKLTLACFYQPTNHFLLVVGGGFEPPKLSRQIYSLIPLATREPLQKGAHFLDVKEGCQH